MENINNNRNNSQIEEIQTTSHVTNQPKQKKALDHFNDWLESLNNLFRKEIKRPYYYVPPCPFCGSLVTGRFMKARNDYDADWIVDESLRHGEIVSPVPNVLSENCFCCECNLTFVGNVECKFICADDINQQKLDRNIYEIWQARNAEKSQKEVSGLSKLMNRFR